MNNERQTVRDAESAVRRLLDEMGGFCVLATGKQRGGVEACDSIIEADCGAMHVRIGIEAKSRITPQTATSVCARMKSLPDDLIPVVYAPVISPRVADILARFGVGYVDQAGNCRLRSDRHRLLIDRRGYKSSTPPPKGAVDLFSPKSSRVVRALLNEPAKGWMVRELADQPEVEVSVGLVAKVKQTLLQESYAIEHDRLLYLRDPLALLATWAERYRGPVEQISLYVRGEQETAEEVVAGWCRANALRYALAGLSAAWRLAPEVRHKVTSVYVESSGFDRMLLEKLRSDHGGKIVETGANLQLWRPFDRSVFVGSAPQDRPGPPITSALQTFLDLKRIKGRGEEAAAAVLERLLARPLRDAAQRVEEMCREQL